MKGLKGLELPINVIVIVAIAVLVLVVAAALFSSQFGAGVGTINLEQAYTKGCSTLRAVYNCDPSKFSEIQVEGFKIQGRNVPEGKQWSTLEQICQEKFFGTSGQQFTNACLSNCGCPIQQPTP